MSRLISPHDKCARRGLYGTPGSPMTIAWTVAVVAIIALGASGYGEASGLREPAPHRLRPM